MLSFVLSLRTYSLYHKLRSLSRVFLNFSVALSLSYSLLNGASSELNRTACRFRSLGISVPFGVIIVYHILRKINIDKSIKNIDKCCATPGHELVKPNSKEKEKSRSDFERLNFL